MVIFFVCILLWRIRYFLSSSDSCRLYSQAAASIFIHSFTYQYLQTPHILSPPHLQSSLKFLWLFSFRSNDDFVIFISISWNIFAFIYFLFNKEIWTGFKQILGLHTTNKTQSILSTGTWKNIQLWMQYALLLTQIYVISEQAKP